MYIPPDPDKYIQGQAAPDSRLRGNDFFYENVTY